MTRPPVFYLTMAKAEFNNCMEAAGMTKKEQLYEGKAKKVFATDDPELLIVSYKDDATAFNGLKKGTIAGKGIINNQMSNALMGYLSEKRS